MADIRSGSLVAFFLFDVAESANLSRVSALIGGPATPARLAPKPATPPYVQYDKPPLSFEGEAVGVNEIEGLRARVRVYDYGVISVALTRACEGSWADFVGLGQTFIENPELEQRAEQLCRLVIDRLRPALVAPRGTFLSEDYVVFTVNALEHAIPADELLAARGDEIAALLRGERQPLSRQEKEKVL